jgi:hypothetical protein
MVDVDYLIGRYDWADDFARLNQLVRDFAIDG